jgi:uncharacterized protein YfaT (DUF1175 family)
VHALVFALTLAHGAPTPGDALLRTLVAETALAQQKRVDPAWNEHQRDCAGLVRFAYKSAYKKLRPARLSTPLFHDDHGCAVDFADAEALVKGSFTSLGRDAHARAQLATGDLLVFRQDRGDGDVVWHLMIAIVAPGGEARVVYHPGEPGAAVKSGALRELTDSAPIEWRPVSENGAFLGFYRFNEWTDITTSGAPHHE